MDLSQEASAFALGYITSKSGRLLRNGAAFGTSEKLEVAEKVTFSPLTGWRDSISQDAR
jgi:hypothetical protein